MLVGSQLSSRKFEIYTRASHRHIESIGDFDHGMRDTTKTWRYENIPMIPGVFVGTVIENLYKRKELTKRSPLGR